ncbi:MAG: transketolase C-terminal domain-containing protein [Bacteroidales bacterium]|nr:transketolase C-terminal domain-containing protein [Bacteroidales bacterium]
MPLDNKLLAEAFEQHEIIITIEDGVINGGMGSALMEWAQENDFRNKIIRLGVPDQFMLHGKPEELQQICGFDAAGIAEKVRLLYLIQTQ